MTLCCLQDKAIQLLLVVQPLWKVCGWDNLI